MTPIEVICVLKLIIEYNEYVIISGTFCYDLVLTKNITVTGKTKPHPNLSIPTLKKRVEIDAKEKRGDERVKNSVNPSNIKGFKVLAL